MDSSRSQEGGQARAWWLGAWPPRLHGLCPLNWKSHCLLFLSPVLFSNVSPVLCPLVGSGLGEGGEGGEGHGLGQGGGHLKQFCSYKSYSQATILHGYSEATRLHSYSMFTLLHGYSETTRVAFSKVTWLNCYKEAARLYCYIETASLHGYMAIVKQQGSTAI